MKNTMLILLAMSIISETCFAQATMEKYNKIKNGMKYSSVESILGHPQKETMSMDVMNVFYVNYQWKGNAKHSMLGISFSNDVVIGKIQVGLE